MAHGLAGLQLTNFKEIQNWFEEWFMSVMLFQTTLFIYSHTTMFLVIALPRDGIYYRTAL